MPPEPHYRLKVAVRIVVRADWRLVLALAILIRILLKRQCSYSEGFPGLRTYRFRAYLPRRVPPSQAFHSVSARACFESGLLKRVAFVQ